MPSKLNVFYSISLNSNFISLQAMSIKYSYNKLITKFLALPLIHNSPIFKCRIGLEREKRFLV